MPTDTNCISATFKSHLRLTPPECMYHYTTQAGLLGIIGTSELWATKIHYLNDSTEFSLALKLAEETITQGWGMMDLVGDAVSLSPRQRLARRIWRAIDRIAKVNVFVACFCESPDLLSQWRGYSQSSYGYSVGFNGQALLGHIAHFDFRFTFGRCIYKDEVHRQIVQETIDSSLDRATEEAEGDDAIERDFLLAMIGCGAFFKHHAFEVEEEWRLVSSPIRSPQLSFRPGKSMITPYFPIPIGSGADSSIDHVFVGPCPHMELAREAVTSLLMANGIGKRQPTGFAASPPQPDVRGSAIPFRDW
jgi:Protein of unknown function (DUF2971)